VLSLFAFYRPQWDASQRLFYASFSMASRTKL
jgi:hypothetical protein